MLCTSNVFSLLVVFGPSALPGLHTRVEVIQSECWVASVIQSTTLHLTDENIYEQMNGHDVQKDKQPSQRVLLDQPHSSRRCGIQCPAAQAQLNGSLKAGVYNMSAMQAAAA